jgi:hypothetical protein
MGLRYVVIDAIGRRERGRAQERQLLGVRGASFCVVDDEGDAVRSADREPLPVLAALGGLDQAAAQQVGIA